MLHLPYMRNIMLALSKHQYWCFTHHRISKLLICRQQRNSNLTICHGDIKNLYSKSQITGNQSNCFVIVLCITTQTIHCSKTSTRVHPIMTVFLNCKYICLPSILQTKYVEFYYKIWSLHFLIYINDLLPTVNSQYKLTLIFHDYCHCKHGKI